MGQYIMELERNEVILNHGQIISNWHSQGRTIFFHSKTLYILAFNVFRPINIKKNRALRVAYTPPSYFIIYSFSYYYYSVLFKYSKLINRVWMLYTVLFESML